MMMADDKKKRVAMIVAKLSPAKPSQESESEETPEPDDSMDMGLEAAAEDIMSSWQAKDPKAFASALKSFIQMCQDYPEQEESPESAPEAE